MIRQLKASVGKIRTATFQDQEHLVVPIIALVEGVLHASNAEHPELVTMEVVAPGVIGWNGRPVMFNHPQRGGEMVSANAPQILDSESLGLVFNARVEEDKLMMDAFINPEQVEKVGEPAVELIKSLQDGEVAEVSIGAIVKAEEKQGSFNGIPYLGIWTEIIPDHLAILPTGTKGACSVDAGCGTRAASRKEPDVKDEKSWLR